MYQSSFHSSWNALRICTTALNIRHSISWGFMVRLKFTWGGRLDHTHLWHIKYAYICYIIRYCCAYMMICAYDLQSNRGKSQEVGPKSYKNCASDTHAHKSPCKHRVNETWKVNIDTYKRKIQVLATLQQCIPSCIYSTQIYVNSFCQLSTNSGIASSTISLRTPARKARRRGFRYCFLEARVDGCGSVSKFEYTCIRFCSDVDKLLQNEDWDVMTIICKRNICCKMKKWMEMVWNGGLLQTTILKPHFKQWSVRANPRLRLQRLPVLRLLRFEDLMLLLVVCWSLLELCPTLYFFVVFKLSL